MQIHKMFKNHLPIISLIMLIASVVLFNFTWVTLLKKAKSKHTESKLGFRVDCYRQLVSVSKVGPLYMLYPQTSYIDRVKFKQDGAFKIFDTPDDFLCAEGFIYPVIMYKHYEPKEYWDEYEK